MGPSMPGQVGPKPTGKDRVTNQPTSQRGWRANPAYIDAAHRVHARVEDGIRTGKDCGIGHFPSHDFAINAA